MATLRQDANGNFRSRVRLPDQVREEYGRLYGPRVEAKFFAPASVGLHGAKQKFREWEAEVVSRIAAIRAAQRGEGIDLTRKEALGLAGEWYNWFVTRHEDNPGEPERWEMQWWALVDAMLEHAPDEVRAEPIRDLKWTRDPEVRAGIRPVLADRGHTAQFLADRGIALANAARTLFLDCMLDNYGPALLLLERRAKGDYEPDELPNSFPPFSPRNSGNLTPRQLFDAWVKSKQPAQSTIESWKTVFNALERDFPDRASSTIKPDEAQEWLDNLITEERSPFTVRNTWLRATRTVFKWGIKRKLVTSNVFADAVVDVPRRRKLRPKYFYEGERTTILKAATAVTNIDNPDDAARRWVPWVLAYTGARPQEITQLRGSDVRQVEGIWTANLTPEAGVGKSGQARLVPLHDHLIEQGFLDFVRGVGDGPLFYKARLTKTANSDPTKQPKLPAAQVRQRLASWVREIGVKDEHLSPNHAWRHTFKLIGRRFEERETLLDHICGHTPATEGGKYGEATLSDLADVIRRFPRYEVGE
ncbi:MAG: hypothetical protein KGK33_06910 [Hyphomicrobiales bacterium]|nr:hypothetical protein [Hyphomicrobiales bacterium]